MIEMSGHQIVRETKALNGLFWELLEDLCSQGWEPFSSNKGCAFPSHYSEDYNFRRVES